MLELTYIGEKVKHKVHFDIISANIVKISGELPEKTKGVILSRENEEDNWDYSSYTTVYSREEGYILFSNDGSVKPLPAITFIPSAGGKLEGKVKQEIEAYEDLIIPEIVAEENYIFSKWSPEIPESGKIMGNQSFNAVFEYIPTLEQVIEAKVVEMNAIQQQVIHQGVDVQLTDGTKEHFTLTDQDQASLMALQSQVAQGTEYVPWHNSNQEIPCKYYKNEDMIKIVQAALAYVIYHVTYFRDLRIYIRSLTKKEEVAKVTYGMVLPAEFQSQVLKDTVAQMAAGQEVSE